MTPTDPSSSARNEDSRAAEGTRRSSPSRRRGGASAYRGVGFAGWTVLGILVALAVFYGWRTSSNHEHLTQRNLRELHRIGRAVEGRIDGFIAGMKGWKESAAGSAYTELVPGLLRTPSPCTEEEEGASVIQDGIRLCYQIGVPRNRSVPWDAASIDTVRWWSGDFDLAPLEPALRTDLFDAVFLAADSSRVFMTRGIPGLRLQEIPPDTGGRVQRRVSTVRTVTIGGEEYLLFLQPLAIRGVERSGGGTASRTGWSVGGLVSSSRFRAESLSLDPPHLIFFGGLLLLALLAQPYLRAALMGRWESIKVRDVYLLSLSLVLATGLLGIVVADIHYFGPFSKAVDRNLAAAAGRLAGSLHGEIGRALDEMELWQPDLDRPNGRVRVFENGLDGQPAGAVASLDRYPGFQMITWVRPDGMQADKVTPREMNTPLIDVATRAYFRRIVSDQAYRLEDGGGAGRAYFLESIRSRNTGEKIAVVSAPYCWAEPAGSGSCPQDSLGIRDMVTRLASLDATALPPGVRFAVLRHRAPQSARGSGESLGPDADTLTLFHSDPERNLAENFLKETDDDAQLRALLAAREPGRVRAKYMGRRSRVYATPLDGSPLSLVLVLDEALPATAHFESLFESTAAFVGWVALLLIAFLSVEALLPGRLRWAWPDRDRPDKYPLLTVLLLGFALLLVLQAVLTVWLRRPVEPSTFLVPFQALSVALLVQSAHWPERASGSPGRSPAWRRPQAIGWAALGLATVLQAVLHLASPAPWWYRLLLFTGEAAMVAAAAVAVRRFPAERRPDDPGVALEPWYVATIVVALATTALLPGYLLHQDALRQHIERLVHYEQARLLTGLEAREDSIRSRNRELKLPPALDSLMIADATPSLAAWPVLAARTEVSGSLDECRESESALERTVFSRIEHRMPFVTAAAVDTRHLGSEAGGLRFESCDGGVLRASVAAGRATRLTIHSGVYPPGAVEAPWRIAFLLVLLAAGCGGVALLGRWLGRRVFLLDLPRSSPLKLIDHLPAAGGSGGAGAGAPVIAICTRSMDRRPLREGEREDVHYVDLVEVAGEKDALAEALGTVPESKLLILDHFDHRLDDAAWSEALLAALEDLVLLRGRRLVLLTSRQPSALFPLVGHGGDARDSLVERWTRLLSQFVDVAVAEIGDHAAGVPAVRPLTPVLAGVVADVVGAGTVAALPDRASDRNPEANPESKSEEHGEREVTDESAVADEPAVADDAEARETPEAREAAAVAKGADEAEQVLQWEAGENRRLKAIAAQVRRRPEFRARGSAVAGRGAAPKPLSAEAVVQEVREMGDSYYHALWAILEDDEKLVVAQLAHGVVVNPSGKRAVRRLLARKILRRLPDLRLMNESFGRFVREEVPTSAMEGWERSGGEGASPWQRLRVPLLFAFLTAVAFLFVTQRSAFDSAVAVVTAAGFGATALLRLLTAVKLPGRGSD